MALASRGSVERGRDKFYLGARRQWKKMHVFPFVIRGLRHQILTIPVKGIDSLNLVLLCQECGFRSNRFAVLTRAAFASRCGRTLLGSSARNRVLSRYAQVGG